MQDYLLVQGPPGTGKTDVIAEVFFFFSSRRRHTRFDCDWSSDVCSSDLVQEAAIRVLTRHGIEVVLPSGQGCCGGIVHHMGHEDEALTAARRNVDVWTFELGGAGLDAILITASGCGTTVKDYGFMLRTDPAF